MAIQPKKIPTPETIKTTSHSFDKSEIEQLKILRTKTENLTFNLGQLTINKIKLEKIEKQYKQELSNLEKEEITLAETLTKKYGKGSIDLKIGTFTPTK